MKKLKDFIKYFTKTEWILMTSSILLILVFFVIYDRVNYMTLVSSLIGVISLVLAAKGNPLGQALILVFCVLYGIISYSYSYYGEMVTCLGMTAPMAIFSLIAWLSNPYHGKKSEVKVNHLKGKEYLLLIGLEIVVTTAFYFILKALNTTNLIPSTISITTSFAAVYFTARRSRFFGLAYAANDIVLIVLWILASRTNIAYLSTVICFGVFLVNDLYGFINWSLMRKRQKQLDEKEVNMQSQS